MQVPNIGPLRIRLKRDRYLWLRPPLANEWYPLAVLKSFVRPGDTVWDVGAHLGLYSRWLVQHLKAGKVCAFEPLPQNLPELEYNLALGKVTDRVRVLNCALSGEDGTAEFQMENVHSGMGALAATRAAEESWAHGLAPVTQKVTTRSIDSLLAKKDAPVPDVIKLDVEGAEHQVLEGGRNFFSGPSARLLIETHGLEVSRDCLRFLFDTGHSVAACVPESWDAGRHMKLTPESLARVQDQYDVHFICASKNLADIPATLDYGEL
ncbi:MAG: FkbM family methyltransferase [Chthoniobacterales bacterium]